MVLLKSCWQQSMVSCLKPMQQGVRRDPKTLLAVCAGLAMQALSCPLPAMACCWSPFLCHTYP